MYLIKIPSTLMLSYKREGYKGPIDSIMKPKLKYEPNQSEPDGTIVTVIQSDDSTEIGVYKWINGKKIFVRKLKEDEKE